MSGVSAINAQLGGVQNKEPSLHAVGWEKSDQFHCLIELGAKVANFISEQISTHPRQRFPLTTNARQRAINQPSNPYNK